MVPPSYMKPIADWNIVMQRIPVHTKLLIHFDPSIWESVSWVISSNFSPCSTFHLILPQLLSIKPSATLSGFFLLLLSCHSVILLFLFIHFLPVPWVLGWPNPASNETDILQCVLSLHHPGGSESTSGCQNNLSLGITVPEGVEWYL